MDVEKLYEKDIDRDFSFLDKEMTKMAEDINYEKV